MTNSYEPMLTKPCPLAGGKNRAIAYRKQKCKYTISHKAFPPPPPLSTHTR
jgi:hypothetical protein